MTGAPHVVVCGTGLAGSVAADRLAARGARVTVLEKRDAPGGSSWMSGGWFALAGTARQREHGIEDSAAVFRDDLVRSGGGFADPALLDRLVDRQHEAIAALDRAAAWRRELKTSAGMSRPRAHLADIRRLLSDLHDRLRARGVEVRLGCGASALLDDGGAVRGVRTEAGDIAADAVVLATGGFSRARDLIALFAPDQLPAMPYGGPGNTGDGLRMAWRLGAGLADVGHVAGTYGQHPDTGDDEHELLTANYLGAILVDARGDRFVDESASYKRLGPAVLARAGGHAFQVFDATVRARSRPGVPLSDIDRIEELGHLVRADSIADLERRLEIPRGRLQRTMAQYAEVAAGRRADPFGRRSLVGGTGALAPLSTAPFYAYGAVTAMTSTYGGVRIDPTTQVRRVDGSAIAGLYAAGEVAGGVHGSSYMTGAALTWALVSGVLAAEAAIAG
ncbi:FAD-dependent oxidoreductase [Microbacterium sp. NPDC091313]